MDDEYEGATGDEKLVAEIRECFRVAEEAESKIRLLSLDDLKFRVGEQWPADVKRQREIDERPCLTINRLPQFCRQVTNELRQNRPGIKVSPETEEAAQSTADIFQGLVRHIEQASDADIAYDTAARSAVDHGFGYFRIITEYCDDNSFDQDIKFKRIRNPFKVYFDPSVQAAVYEDANWCILVEDLHQDKFKADYPNSELSNMVDWASVGDSTAQWVRGKMVRVAEFYKVVYKNVRRVQLSTGEIVDKSEIEVDEDKNYILPPGIEVVQERTVKRRKIMWYKTNGYEILDRTEWLGYWIPVVPVLGDESEVDGERILEGVVRQAKDPQRMYNYWATAETETIALAPRAPYIGAEGQFEGNETQWKQANIKNFAYLQYKPKSFNGELAPPPQRNQYEPATAAITNARMQAADDLKATTGIYDAALGNRGNERSGKAIMARNNQSQTSNFHYSDNLSRSVRHAGRILVDLIPKIWDTAKVVQIIDGEGKKKAVPINQPFMEGGVQKSYMLGKGRYGVAIEAGPGYATKRQQAVENMLELTQAFPALVQIAGDLMVKNMDWPGSQEVSDRLKKTLPPELQEQSTDVPPQLQQQIGQMNQMIEQLTAKLNEANDKLGSKQAELDSKEKIAFAQMRVDLVTSLAATQSKESTEALKIEASAHTESVAAKREQEVAALQQELSNLQAAQPSPDDSKAAAISEEALNTLLEKLTTVEAQLMVPRKKVGRAIPQPDGSYVMEATEQ